MFSFVSSSPSSEQYRGQKMESQANLLATWKLWEHALLRSILGLRVVLQHQLECSSVRR